MIFLRRRRPVDQTDEALVAALRSGHQPALAALWDRYALLLYGVAMKYLKDSERCKDLVTELFVDLPALLTKHHVERLRPWLHSVVRNRCLMLLRSQRPSAELHDSAAPEDTLDDAVLREQDLQRLEQAITQLNAEQAQCIRLFHLDQLSYQQCSERTGFSVEQVRSHLQNGRRNLKLLLQRMRKTA
jgi:RNA polymerase sigma-70 factor (ECF subfamily)